MDFPPSNSAKKDAADLNLIKCVFLWNCFEDIVYLTGRGFKYFFSR